MRNGDAAFLSNYFSLLRVDNVVIACVCLQVNTGTSALLYSVCLRDRGPNNRGFVQLPTVVDDDGNVATYPVDPAVLCQAARCYVDTCPCAATLLNCPTYSINRDCVHIRAAIACTADAQPLEIDPSVVDSFSSVTEDVRTVLRHFIANEACPVIQRVTRSVFVVRSQPACEHTLEFVHVIFAESVRSRVDASRKFTCDCRTFQVPCTYLKDSAYTSRLPSVL